MAGKTEFKGQEHYLNEDFPKAIMDKYYILQPIMKRSKTMG